ncbi:MAG: polyphosphate kinase 1 [Nitrospirales bacterium]|nr:polyphosphate kinase 1 [Nitrospira sp.]MDR4500032.1 polyphosphate kinase 1 [Nitrospirales bacterium]
MSNDTSIQDSSRPTIDLHDPKLYLNRELSWLEFNSRVLEEAEDQSLPLLERVKFLAIFFSNLDEFFMVRISGLREQVTSGVVETAPDGMAPSDQLNAVREKLLKQLARVTKCWEKDLFDKLQDANIRLFAYDQLSSEQRETLRQYFSQEIFPALTPLAFDPSHPFPHISNLTLNLAVVAQDPERGECFARVKVPNNFPRLIRIPQAERPKKTKKGQSPDDTAPYQYVWLEDIITANLDLLFPGLTIEASYQFRITRDADLAIEEDEAADLLSTIEEQVDMRHFGSVVRMELAQHTPDHIRNILVRNLKLAPYQVFTYDFPLGMSNLMELQQIDRSELKFPIFLHSISDRLANRESMFSAIQQEDQLLFHPYDNFLPVVDFVREAANDPHVLAIKQTLYRVGSNSAIVEALMEARENGKQVAVLFELQARFDEENNIQWARKLEDEGVHVVYGVHGLKTHAKLCLVIRKENDGLRRYLHLGTGNYNPITSRIYTDFSFLTCDDAIGADVSDLFNALTGYSRKETYSKLLVAPHAMRNEILRRIDREIQRHQQHGDGYLAFKMNALVDQDCIRALYRASQVGVKIDLVIRGVCGLRPDIPDVSQTIRVTSIVGRFLEHSRMYYFRNGGDDELYLGSADLMARNLDGRVEVLFPIENQSLKERLVQNALHIHVRDNVKARQLTSDGTYNRLSPSSPEEAFDSQEWFIKNWKDRMLKES